MSKLKVKINNKELFIEKGTTLYDVIKKSSCEQNIPIVLGKINGEYCELTSTIEENSEIEAVNITDKLGSKTFIRTLQFILIKSVFDLFPEAQITIEHSLSKGLFGEIHKNTPLTEEDIQKIKIRMNETIQKNIQIKKVSMDRKKAIEIFSTYRMEDKVRLLNHVNTATVKLYELDGRYDYFYGSMAYSTGIINVFDLKYYEPGFLLKYPIETDPFNIPKSAVYKKLSKIFRETEQWGNILGVGDVGSLNDKVEDNEIIDIIRVAEALHEKKIAYIADMISERKNVKIVLIAGPSSSGKTTFARRLGIQLRVNGLIPIPISLDDYFVDREHTPKDENGEYDFESIYALDLELFNKNLEQLLNYEEIEIPSFNFKTGSREWTNQKIKLPSNGVLIIEGIHGLNEMLTSVIPKENKFKIYISALTQLNVDNHNRIATTDVRIIRRIVRDYLSRGYGGEDTLKMWPSIKRGEEKNIFVFQENADVMFNSTLVYELCVLKQYALKELEKISDKSPVYYEALRLKSFLHFFKSVDVELVPDNSILREFIGGSCFYKY
ncbi:ATPase AAA [Clostridium carboxidivorans P7]|uniref:nucleoside kinase n=1 Tax=Clostridium carboxidivorans TaxID=217159 RepID=UPI0001D38F8F|nr:nucleoside kinase [Clostridium carboxidivorans]AKN33346.1 ATPase AAA [Clostridium carboxidivorans P7]EFG89279.1 phosphoribulokinase / Uridine kinase family protein [Clostridium carboxidivorans P7]